MARQVIVLSGEGRIRKVNAICSQTWLKPSGVLGMAVDILTADVLVAQFGKERADRMAAMMRTVGAENVVAVGRRAGRKGRGRAG